MVSGGIRAARNRSSDDADGNAQTGERVVFLPQAGKRRYLYFFSAPGRIKIGISKNIQQRLAEVGAHLDVEPAVLGFIRATPSFEKHIHEVLSQYRIRNEWFRDCAEVRDAMQQILSGNTLGFSHRQIKKKDEFLPQELEANLFGKVCKAIWPFKTAEHLAAITGRNVRTAYYEIAGEREPSAQSLLAVMSAITPDAKSWK